MVLSRDLDRHTVTNLYWLLGQMVHSTLVYY